MGDPVRNSKVDNERVAELEAELVKLRSDYKALESRLHDLEQTTIFLGRSIRLLGDRVRSLRADLGEISGRFHRYINNKVVKLIRKLRCRIKGLPEHNI